MPTHPSHGPYRPYSPELAVDTLLPEDFGQFVRRKAKPLDTSPSKTLHLYEHRQLPPLPSPSVTESLLDDYESLRPDRATDSGSPHLVRTEHIVNCQRSTVGMDSPITDQLSLFPMPLRTDREVHGSDYEPFAPGLSPPTSRFLTPTLPWHEITGVNVPAGASMELEKHHGSWSIAVYSAANTIALFRLLIDRDRNFMRKQSTKGISRVAMICARPQDTLKVAVTGYLDKPTDLTDYQLPNSLWTCRVFSLCQEIGHAPGLSLHDNGVAGLHNCCHAEKQAVAYLHYQHPSLRKATIHLSDDPCSDCARFLRKFELKYRKHFEVVVYGWKWQDPSVGRHMGTSLRTML